MFQIGDIKLKNNIVLAPMAGISNSAYRTIIKDMGCGLIYAEMVSDKAICYGNEKTKQLLYMTDYERPIAQQIFGSDKESFVKAAKTIYETMKPDIIDINMGCPVPKVALRAQAGSALLKDPKKVYEIVSAVVKSVPVPVTVKIRSGWDENHINAVEIALQIEKAGAKAIAVHGRTRSQGYQGKADWNIIKQVKQAVSIPVIGNGDVKTVLDYQNMLKETGCDAVMIGRGALGNPWLIKECVTYFETGKMIEPPTIQQKIDMLFHHFHLLLKTKCEKLALLEIRSHAAWYLKGIPNTSKLKEKIMRTKTATEFKQVIKEYMEDLYGI